MKNAIVLFLMVLFFNQIGWSQTNSNKLHISHGKYFYQNQVYEKHELGKLFKNDKFAMLSYSKYKDLRGNVKAVEKTAYIGAGIGLAGIGLIAATDDDNTLGFLMAGTGIGSVVVCGGTFIILSISANRNFKQSIRRFNDGLKSNLKTGQLNRAFGIGLTNHGVGLVFNF